MALNWAVLNPNRIPILSSHEMMISTVDSGAEVLLTIPPDSKLEGSKKLNLKASGKLYLTDQSLIFVPDSSVFVSLSVPLPHILSTRFEQPAFGANYLAFGIKPCKDDRRPDCGLTEGTHAELRFKERAMFEFVSLLEKSRERAIYMRRQPADAEEEEGLPQYFPVESSSASGVPTDNPPSYD